MLTLDGCRARRERLWREISPGMEWVLIADPRHVLYYSNFLVSPQSFSAGERALLLLERDGRATLIADNFTLRSAASPPFVDREIVETWYDHQHSVINRDHALLRALRAVSESLYGREGAVEAEWLPVGAHEVLALDREKHAISREVTDPPEAGRAIDLGTLIRSHRRRKYADEIAILKQCMRATEAGHLRAREVVRPGATDFEVYCAVHAAVQEAAGRPVLVYGDFRITSPSRPKAGGMPVGETMHSGDIFLLDYSVVFHGYRSDFTNAIAVGDPSDAQEMLYDLCLAGMKAGEGEIKSGASARQLYSVVSRPREEAGYPQLSHHAGHGIGLAHPEPPILVPESEDVLMAGDVITLEPGMYVEGIGGLRIEHNYLVTESGFERLSNHRLGLT